MRAMGRLVALGVVLAGLLAGAQPADALQFDLTVDHCTGGCGIPPFGTVTLSQNGTAVDVTVQLNSPNWFIKTGAGDSQAFGFNANGVVVGDITVGAHTPTLAAAAGPFHMDGAGNFAFGINCPTCGNGAPDAFNTNILFHVVDATIADFGNAFAADIFSNNLNGLNGNGNTGVVSTGLSPVPEPSSLLLLGTSMVALRMVGRRLKRRAV
jgi:PEP-CTERM motif-containing protein